MIMKEKYVPAEVQIMVFKEKDVLTGSYGNEGGEVD